MRLGSRPLICAAAAAAAVLAMPPALGASGQLLSGRVPRGRAGLMRPADLNEQAPDVFRARFETSAGNFVVEVHREWAPRGADRFYNLVRRGFYDDARFFRVIRGFMAQFGISGDPSIQAVWRSAQFRDDPVTQSNLRGYITFATAGPNTRTTQLFINLVDNANLDRSGFAPFGRVVEGMDVVDQIYDGYGEGAPRGNGPEQGRLQLEGNAYLEQEFPKLDYIRMATVEEE